MSIANWSLLIGALVAAWLSWKQPRAFLWIILAGIDYAVTVAYWRLGLPYAEGFAGLCDAAVCLSIYFLAKERWELLIYRLFQVSVAVNFLFLAGNLRIAPQVSSDTLSIILELINWLVLLLIGGVSAGQFVGLSDDMGLHRAWSARGHIYGFVASLRKARKTPSFISKTSR